MITGSLWHSGRADANGSTKMNLGEILRHGDAQHDPPLRGRIGPPPSNQRAHAHTTCCGLYSSRGQGSNTYAHNYSISSKASGRRLCPRLFPTQKPVRDKPIAMQTHASRHLPMSAQVSMMARAGKTSPSTHKVSKPRALNSRAGGKSSAAGPTECSSPFLKVN